MKTIFYILIISTIINAKVIKCKPFLIKEEVNKEIYKEIRSQKKKCKKETYLKIISENTKIENKDNALWWMNGDKKPCYIRVKKIFLEKIRNEMKEYQRINNCDPTVFGIYENDKF